MDAVDVEAITKIVKMVGAEFKGASPAVPAVDVAKEMLTPPSDTLARRPVLAMVPSELSPLPAIFMAWHVKRASAKL